MLEIKLKKKVACKEIYRLLKKHKESVLATIINDDGFPIKEILVFPLVGSTNFYLSNGFAFDKVSEFKKYIESEINRKLF